MQMLNKKEVLDDQDPEKVKIDENIKNKMSLQEYEVKRRERKKQ